MSQDMVSAITSAHADPAALIERQQADIDSIDLHALESMTRSEAGGGAYIRADLPAGQDMAAGMNLRALAGQFSDGLQDGFYAHDIDRLMQKLELSHRPGSGVTAGDVTVELLNVQAKVGIADAFSKVSSKLAEGLQTMVVRQG